MDTNDFTFLLLIGAQKCGTTTLFDLLSKVDGIIPSKTKEVGFWHKEINYSKGLSWYIDQFDFQHTGKYLLEATPAYIYHNTVPSRILDSGRKFKFIVILRNPSHRAYSAWNMFRKFNSNKDIAKNIYKTYIENSNLNEKQAISELLFSDNFPTFKKCIEDDMERFQKKSDQLEPSFVRRGIYHLQIKNYLKHFSIENFLFLTTKDLTQPINLCNELSKFLNIEINFDENINRANIGEYENLTIKGSSFESLDQFFKEHNQDLFKLLNKNLEW